MRKELSTKRLAVADRYSKRLLYLEKKGIDTSFIKNELKTIPGVSITNKGRISINKSMYSSNQNDILSALENWVPKSTKYKGSKPEKKATKVKKSKELEAELTKRADEISAKFGFDKEEFLRRAEDVDGISFDEESGDIKVDPEFYSEDTESAAYKEVGTVDEMMDEARNELVEEEGLSEGDLENLSDDYIAKRVVSNYMFKDERSVFKKYYDYFDKNTHTAKNGLDYKNKKSEYDKAQTAMSKLGSLLAKEGFKSSSYQQQRISVDGLLNALK